MSVYRPFIDTVATGISNPYGLAAVAATGKHESGFSPRNAFGSWSDPSERGQPGTAGGIMSWRADRFENLRKFAADNGDDPNAPSPETQAKFFLNEDPALIERLNAAGSVEEAQSLMNNAWQFAGYNRPGGEAANRLATARSILGGTEISDGSGGAGQRSTRELNMGSATMAAGYPTGGLGGLGGLGMMAEEEPAPEGIAGFFANPNVMDAIQAMGMSMMSSPSNNMLAGVGETLPAIQRNRQVQEALGIERQDKLNNQRAMQAALLQSGFSPEQAAAYASNPAAATVAAEAMEEQKALATQNKSYQYLLTNEPDIAAQVDAGLPITEGLKLAQERRAAGMKAPNIETIYENGQEQKVIINPDGTYQKIGGSKASTDGAAKLPSGFMPDPNDPTRLTPIPGGPGEQISGELAARVGLAKNFLKEAPELQRRAKEGQVTGPYDQMVGSSFSGTDQAGVLRGWMSGVDALQRMLTGAGQTESEARTYVQRYLPTYTDTAESASKKIGQLQTELQSIEEEVMRGRGGTGREPTTTANPYKNRYGLE